MAKYMVVESPVHGKDVLLSFVDKSSNTKTGPMVQVFILHPYLHPWEAAVSLADERMCGTCPMRQGLGGSCYVEINKGPASTYSSWIKTHNCALHGIDEVLEMCGGKAVRFGAYGDPAHIPPEIATAIMEVCLGWTAYTHDWRKPTVANFWKGKAMASCDTTAHYRAAVKAGWAAFVATDVEGLPGAVECLNDTHGTQCISCLRCNGKKGMSVVIKPHGSRKNKHPGHLEVHKNKPQLKEAI